MIQTPLEKILHSYLLLLVFCCVSLLSALANSAMGQSDHGWTDIENDPAFPGRMVRSRTLVLHPAPEPRPALKYQLIPSDFNLVGENAGVHYLRAMGFIEQTYAKVELDRIWKEALKKVQEQGSNLNDLPPYSWQGMKPADLPLDEVKKFLQLTDFQTAEIVAAHKMRFLNFSRNLRQAESPISTLLPETQQMRDLARTQSLRCRVAIAEKRFDDAFQILGQQFHMANHLSQEPFLVSCLVGVAVAGINWDDALDFVEMPESPNLFWAVSAMPQPLVPLRSAFSFERELFGLELKALQEVDEKVRPAGYWIEFIDRILPQYNRLIAVMSHGSRGEFPLDRFGLASVIAAGYPSAKAFLIESEKMDANLVESYATAQVFFLAQKRYAELALDDYFKWTHIDLRQRRHLESHKLHDQESRERASQIGWAGVPVEWLSPAIKQVEEASLRTELQIAAIQAIEGIRMYAAMNDGRLPPRLSDLPYPVRDDPFTGTPLKYEVNNDTATLTAETQFIIYKLNLSIAR